MDFNLISPETSDELLETINALKDGAFRFGAGYTDLLLELKKQPQKDLTVVNLARLKDKTFTSIQFTEDEVKIGALVTVGALLNCQALCRRFPTLRRAAEQLASGQIRRVATVGGNLCTASPAGDIAAALVALQGECDILSASGAARRLPVEMFFTGVRRTALAKDEILRSVVLKPLSHEKLYSDFIKIGTRAAMECAVVSLAYHIATDARGAITSAGVSIGSSAPTIKFCREACQYLMGKVISSISETEAEEFAKKVLSYADPISDARGSAWYRKEVLFNVSKGIFAEFKE